MRDMFYNGNAQMEQGAVVCRVARSFVRFGSFQLPVARWGQGVLGLSNMEWGGDGRVGGLVAAYLQQGRLHLTAWST